MTVEFISLINVWESSELHPRPGGAPDPAYIRKYARYLEHGGFDYALVAYYSAGYDPFTVSATIAAHTERIKPCSNSNRTVTGLAAPARRPARGRRRGSGAAVGPRGSRR